jgi:hypothetical protein
MAQTDGKNDTIACEYRVGAFAFGAKLALQLPLLLIFCCKTAAGRSTGTHMDGGTPGLSRSGTTIA